MKHELYNHLRDTLRKRGANPMELAIFMNVSLKTVTRWTEGAPPSLLQMRQIANFLLVGVSEIWPAIKEPVDWEYRHQLITERLEKLDFHSPEFSELSQERALVSVKIYIAQSNSLRRMQRQHHATTGWDTSPLNEDIYGRMNPGNKSVLTSY